MNKERRKSLNEAATLCEEMKEKVEKIREIVQTCYDEEESARDNLPENLQEGEKGDQMQEAMDSMDEAISSLEDIGSSLDDVIEDINSAAE